MSHDQRFRIGELVTLGSHTFTADEIVAFATKYDPQVFHLDAEAARESVLGGLCASGWHTCATWMKYNLKHQQEERDAGYWANEPEPEFGPSPGFENLKWLRPVYVDETITFTRTAVRYRPLATRPGWLLLSLEGEAFNEDGTKVLSFENVVLVKE
jgi:acyl dehydratase